MIANDAQDTTDYERTMDDYGRQNIAVGYLGILIYGVTMIVI